MESGEAPLFLVRKSEALGMVADVAVPHTEGILAEFRIGFFHLALEKILADHAGMTNFLTIPYVEDTHCSTFSRYF
jgi:hypothetical protein